MRSYSTQGEMRDNNKKKKNVHRTHCRVDGLGHSPARCLDGVRTCLWATHFFLNLYRVVIVHVCESVCRMCALVSTRFSTVIQYTTPAHTKRNKATTGGNENKRLRWLTVEWNAILSTRCTEIQFCRYHCVVSSRVTRFFLIAHYQILFSF